jgi:hypothetical protein
MSDIKFSEFSNINAPTNSFKIVGYDGIQNVKISPVDLLPNSIGFINNLVVENTNTTLTVKTGLIIDIAGTLLKFLNDSVITPPNVSGYGYKWRCLCIAENSSVITYKDLSDFSNIVGLSESTNQLGLYSMHNNIYGYCRGEIGSIYYRIFYIFKQFSNFTDPTVDTQSTKILTCDDTSKLSIGQKVSGTDIPTYSEIVEIIDSTSFRINNDCTGSTSNITMTIIDDIIEGYKIENNPKTIVLGYTHILVNTYNASAPEIEIHTIEVDINSEFSNVGIPKINSFIPKKNSLYNIFWAGGMAAYSASYIFQIYMEKNSCSKIVSSTYSNQILGIPYMQSLKKNDVIKLHGYAPSGNPGVMNVNSDIRGTYIIIKEV